MGRDLRAFRFGICIFFFGLFMIVELLHTHVVSIYSIMFGQQLANACKLR